MVAMMLVVASAARVRRVLGGIVTRGDCGGVLLMPITEVWVEIEMETESDCER
jgi:hypothetical protein